MLSPHGLRHLRARHGGQARAGCAGNVHWIFPRAATGCGLVHRFVWWRHLFGYDRNLEFATALEIAFRAAFWLTLFAWPTIHGTLETQTKVFRLTTADFIKPGAVVACVYTLAPSAGITIKHVAQGLSGSVTAAVMSWLMYAVYYDGCTGKPASWPQIDACHFWLGDLTRSCDRVSSVHLFFPQVDPCFYFGIVAGAFSIMLVLLLQLPSLFQIFYCSNFVFYWMAFLNSAVEDATGASLRRSDPRYAHTVELFGCQWNDWGGGVSKNIITMLNGCFFALLITTFPYPITCLAQATDHVELTTKSLEQHWKNTIAFYVAPQKDEMNKAHMMSSMGSVKDEIDKLDRMLEGTFWEVLFFPWVSYSTCPRLPPICTDSRMARHANLTKLRGTLCKCIERLCHVVDACEREKFEESHQALMLSCQNAVESLASCTFLLLDSAVQKAQDGVLTEDEKDELMNQVKEVEYFENLLSDEVKACIQQLTRRKSVKVAQEVRGQLATEQVARWRIHVQSLPFRRQHTHLLQMARRREDC
ncbi:unnamed protein product [Prorocentrum cordatum]|uniref:Uncharacterized protein n=1 Tax=Prorocentrum cordatum TaxID=2364126 RepID=A0ABN9R914_9DINO|nr:unnamed protein product [Polarella glacialis]